MSKQGLWRWFSSSEGLEDLRRVFAAAKGQHGVAVAPTRVTQRVLQHRNKHRVHTTHFRTWIARLPRTVSTSGLTNAHHWRW
jgi:hypothetical protein